MHILLIINNVLRIKKKKKKSLNNIGTGKYTK